MTTARVRSSPPRTWRTSPRSPRTGTARRRRGSPRFRERDHVAQVGDGAALRDEHLTFERHATPADRDRSASGADDPDRSHRGTARERERHRLVGADEVEHRGGAVRRELAHCGRRAVGEQRVVRAEVEGTVETVLLDVDADHTRGAEAPEVLHRVATEAADTDDDRGLVGPELREHLLHRVVRGDSGVGERCGARRGRGRRA